MAKEIVFKINVQGSKDVLDLERQIKQLKKEIKESTDDNVATKLTKDLDILSVKLKEARNQARIAQADLTAKDTTIGSYARLSAQLVLARERFKELAANSGSSAKQIEAARVEAARLDSQLKKIDANTGVFGRNVGNYAGSLRGMFQQLNASLKNVGLAGRISSIPRLFGAISSAVDTAFKGIEAYNKAYNSTSVISGVVKEKSEELIGTYTKEKTKLNDLRDAVQDETLSKEERQTAIDALQNQFPDYFDNLTLENSKTGELEKSYDAATAALKRNAKERLAIVVQEELQKKAVLAQLDAVAAEQESQRLTQQRADLVDADASAEKYIGIVTNGVETAYNYLSNFFTASTAATSVTAAQDGATIKKIVGDLVEDTDEAVNEITDGTKLTAAQIKALADKTEAEQQKAAAAAKKRREDAKREDEKRLKQIEDYSKAELDFKIKTIDQVGKLQKELSQLVVSNIEDEGDKVKAQEELNYQQRKQDRINQQNDLAKLFEEQEKKLLEVYKEGSKEVVAFRAETFATLTNITNKFNEIAVQDEIEHVAKVAEIDKTAQEKLTADEKEEQDKRLAQTSEYLAELESGLELELLKVREQVAKKTITIEQAAETETKARRKNLEEQLRITKFTLTNETNLSEQQRIELTLQAQKLTTDLAELEDKQTEKVKTENQKRKEARLAAVDSALSDASSAITAVQGVADTIAAGDQERFQKQLDQRNEKIANLQKDLETATGLEAQYLEDKISREQLAADAVEKKQKDARKRAAIANKAFAIAQAVINAALSITALNAAIVDPTPVQGFRLAALAITAGVNIAAIAAIAAAPLKFAKGGYTGMGTGTTDETGFKQAGIVHEGEWVAPAWMVNSPNFAAAIGGLEAARTGRTPAVVPSFSSRSSAPAQNDQLNMLVIETNKLARETANKLNTLEVVHTTRTQTAIEKDKKEVQFNTKGTKL